MTPFPNLGYVTGLDGKVFPIPAVAIQRSASVSATNAQTIAVAVLANMPNMVVSLTLEVPCAVLLLAAVQLTVSVAVKPVSLRFVDAAAALVGLLWGQDFHNTQEVCIPTIMALTTGVVGSNTWYLQWAATVVCTASVTNRYMLALAFPS
jgi:hypothetical protein